MTKTSFHRLAKQIAREAGFKLDKEIYCGSYYAPDKIRNIIFSGVYRGRPAVLKIYDDPRLTDEPVSQVTFNKVNSSKILTAPKVYKYKVMSPHKGWLIMEKLPEGGSFFKQPVEDKAEFARLYLEYRLNFPQRPTRRLTLPENLRADQFHTFRISRWLEIAAGKEFEAMLARRKPLLRPEEFMPRLEKALDVLQKEFKKRKMIWCHGHFKPHELFKAPDRNLFYLIDFGHSKMYPEGYEFAFIIWADWLVSSDWKLSYKKWKRGIDEWIDVFRPLARRLGIKRFDDLIVAALAERVIGTILVDVHSGQKTNREKIGRINLLYSLLDDIV